ncbi:unnamed protein product [Arctia plantaginis]|uniref:Uncharacterized protein n=1 Tax=Arctia plantaginis TaxID=874455 RepID=A0A8S0ZIV3_ARCPL|nr:unnamed protein product [Arctia plantaginis]
MGRPTVVAQAATVGSAKKTKVTCDKYIPACGGGVVARSSSNTRVGGARLTGGRAAESPRQQRRPPALRSAPAAFCACARRRRESRHSPLPLTSASDTSPYLARTQRLSPLRDPRDRLAAPTSLCLFV